LKYWKLFNKIAGSRSNEYGRRKSIMAIIKLQAESREETGSKASRRLRDAGFIPASLYAHGNDPTLLKLDAKEWMKHLTDQLNLVNIEFGKNEQVAAVREIQRDPMSQDALHVDFYAVKMDEVTSFNVKLEFTGSPIGIANGGVRAISNDYVDVECLPTDVPDLIEVNTEDLDIGHAITAGDIVLPENVKLQSDPSMVLISVTAVRMVLPEDEEPVEAVPEGEEGEAAPAEGEAKEEPEEK